AFGINPASPHRALTRWSAVAAKSRPVRRFLILIKVPSHPPGYSGTMQSDKGYDHESGTLA
ncbi:MAG TPA: hypothetical protein VGC31_00815, partial [Paenirhodobacter sp.]